MATLLLSGAVVRADSIPWGYSAAGTEIHNSNNPLKSSSVKFNGSSSVATGDSGIIIYNLESTSSADLEAPDSFASVPFHLEVLLTDILSGGTGTPTGLVKFDGLFNASKVTKSSMLPDSPTWSGPTKAEVVLGSKESGFRKYSVEISSFTPPGQPGGAPGSVQAVVRIEDDNGGGGPGTGEPNPTPEPTSILLAGLGLPLVLLARRRMKKAEQN
jgi:hypothetical protein